MASSPELYAPLTTVRALGDRKRVSPRISPLAWDDWLDLLGKDENCPPEGIIDSNGKLSIGQFCFQKGTFERYTNQYGMFGEITDNVFQRKLAARIIKGGGWKNWMTTIKKIGIPK